MIEFLTVDSEGLVHIAPKHCTSISREKRAGYIDRQTRSYAIGDIVTLHMAGGQKWRIETMDFNRHASDFGTIMFL